MNVSVREKRERVSLNVCVRCKSKRYRISVNVCVRETKREREGGRDKERECV